MERLFEQGQQRRPSRRGNRNDGPKDASKANHIDTLMAIRGWSPPWRGRGLGRRLGSRLGWPVPTVWISRLNKNCDLRTDLRMVLQAPCVLTGFDNKGSNNGCR